MRAQDQQAARGTHRPRLPDRTQHAPSDAAPPTTSAAAAVRRTAGSTTASAARGGVDHP
ncbi:hypothetical protein [Streptomyces sp. NPDC050485]|uniref:hypothetical protein n=1 Tax=Streptomyces sp. NPDC050485 TaxID=3365617 RepID=UPI0037BA5BF9